MKRGAFLLLIAMVAILGWMKVEWRDIPLEVSGPAAGAQPTVSHNVGFVTPAQQQYLDAAASGADKTYTAVEWSLLRERLKGHEPAPAPPVAEQAPSSAVAPVPAPVAHVTPDLPGYKIAINGSSSDALVDSINQITAALPDRDARVFQKSVRMLIVGSLPIQQMIAAHVQPSQISEPMLLDAARSKLNGMKAMDVIRAAERLHETLVQESRNHTGPFAATAAQGPTTWGN
ncbi:hypothetical protein [Rhodanobacter sp. FW106-PBR-LB-2-11]|uniref:hypothetical protein n=1 Tax=Rhodanobacter sp. FW106-PBR-LB-2-11 TaxID=1524463 RepID=UPI0034E3C04F